MNEALQFLKKHEYDQELVLNWFNEQIKKIFLEENFVSKGIPL